MGVSTSCFLLIVRKVSYVVTEAQKRIIFGLKYIFRVIYRLLDFVRLFCVYLRFFIDWGLKPCF